VPASRGSGGHARKDDARTSAGAGIVSVRHKVEQLNTASEDLASLPMPIQQMSSSS